MRSNQSKKERKYNGQRKKNKKTKKMSNRNPTKKTAVNSKPVLFVTQICRNGKPNHDGDRKTSEVITST